ncbi:hypothetical protein BZA77DRAFT_134127 [Pyronema omphalodes]|nr:hypothetical protein BZA77DRAFT_134127 [Pyronema omphalodes]
MSYLCVCLSYIIFLLPASFFLLHHSSSFSYSFLSRSSSITNIPYFQRIYSAFLGGIQKMPDIVILLKARLS